MTEITIESVIERLQRATKPARSLDTSIGELVGWIKKVKYEPDLSGNPTRIISWMTPEGTDSQGPPLYTTNLQCAYDLAISIDRNCIGAVTWEGVAEIWGGPKITALNPQIAICIVALIRLKVLTGRR